MSFRSLFCSQYAQPRSRSKIPPQKKTEPGLPLAKEVGVIQKDRRVYLAIILVVFVSHQSRSLCEMFMFIVVLKLENSCEKNSLPSRLSKCTKFSILVYLIISDLILFDGKGYEKSIGFNHELLNSIPNSINKMIAGNIKIEDITNFNDKDYFIDLSGSLENELGKKDLKKINKLLNLQF